MFTLAMFGVLVSRFVQIVYNIIDKMDSKICFEMSLFVVAEIRGRCARFMILTALVSEICGGQTNVPILVV